MLASASQTTFGPREEAILAEATTILREERISRGETLNEPKLDPNWFQARLDKGEAQKAFLVTRGIGAAVRTAADITVTFRAGHAVRFGTGTTVELFRPENWRGGDRIIIAIDKVWSTSDYCLRAMCSQDASEGGLAPFMLGGFQLDPTGAVIADSFYDIVAAQEAAETRSRFDQLVDLLVNNKQQGFITDLNDIKAAGLADDVTMQRFAEAILAAEKRTADRDIADCPVTYDRADRVERLANLLAGYFAPNGEGWDVARRAGFPSRELGDIWQDATTRAGVIAKGLPVGAN